ncbi:hypothetical protein FACS189490_02030 [Clostridia bacterium]|nr:hypothetical protein FACS189490_02030 [Clostridia bacterium]
MNIVYKNDGVYPEYELTGNKLTIEDELTVNLAKYERDDDAHVDICKDNNGNLVMGIIPGAAEFYAAQIDIPAREYAETVEGEDVVFTAVPFSPDNVTLTLWGV